MSITIAGQSDITIIGQQANEYASQNVFLDYLSRKSANTIGRHARELRLFSTFLSQTGINIASERFQTDPQSWSGITWGLVESFRQWMLKTGYAIGTVNICLSTVKVYAKLAAKVGAINHTEAALIKDVSGYSHKESVRVDEKRSITRIGHKKSTNTSITPEQAKLLKTHPDTPQGRRDTLLMCLLLDQGLRCGEVASLKVEDFNLTDGTFRIYRSKVDKTQTHRMMPDTLRAVLAWFNNGDVPEPSEPILRSSNGKNIKGHWQELSTPGMATVSITHRVQALGKRIGIAHLSAHDCRHYWATHATRSGTGAFDLQEAGGWSSLAMPARYVEAARIANEGVKGF